jgi:hypothetical protein
MIVVVDMIRNHPDFIMERDGARIQDTRFVVFQKIPLFYFLFIRIIVFFYDLIKDDLRRREDLEAGHHLHVNRKERRGK